MWLEGNYKDVVCDQREINLPELCSLSLRLVKYWQN